MKLDLHTHTCHSFDCNTSIENFIVAAESAGLDAIAITDHDTMSAVKEAEKLANKISIIPGMEITTSKGVHIIGLFLNNEVVSKNILEVIDEIHIQGGLVMLPHPFRPGSGLIYAKDKHRLFSADEAHEIISKIDLVETVNLNCTTDELVETDNFFVSYSNLPHVAGSDAHFPENIGKALVELENMDETHLANIKQALLHSSRTIRYEAYKSEPVQKDHKKTDLKIFDTIISGEDES